MLFKKIISYGISAVENIKNLFSVKHKTLVLITGFIWLAVSFLMFKRAYEWLELFNNLQLIAVLIVGVIFSGLKYFFIFRKATNKNIHRIMNLKGEKVSVFAFHTLRFYFVILLMIGGGILLRNLEFIPKYCLFPVYMGVGFAMFIASFMYFKFFIQKFKNS